MLAQKDGWVDVALLNNYQGNINLKWTPVSVKSEFPKLNSEKLLYNHFEFHREISRKNDLFTNLSNHANYCSENVFDLVPLTFHLFISAGKLTENLDIALKKFDSLFATLDINRHQVVSELNYLAAVRKQSQSVLGTTNDNHRHLSFN